MRKFNASNVFEIVKKRLVRIKIDCFKNSDEEINEEQTSGSRETWTGRFDFFLSALSYAGKKENSKFI